MYIIVPGENTFWLKRLGYGTKHSIRDGNKKKKGTISSPSSYAYLLKASWKITILPCASVSSVKYQWWYHMATCLELYRETKEMVRTNILLFLYLTHLTHLIQISFLLSLFMNLPSILQGRTIFCIYTFSMYLKHTSTPEWVTYYSSFSWSVSVIFCE